MEMSADEILRHQKSAWDRARRDEEARIRMAEAKKSAEIAVNLLNEGLPVSMIAKVTGLSPEEIERLSAQ
jgi:DNA invertase Pin-like site-specific DNA recombinase